MKEDRAMFWTKHIAGLLMFKHVFSVYKRRQREVTEAYRKVFLVNVLSIKFRIKQWKKFPDVKGRNRQIIR